MVFQKLGITSKAFFALIGAIIIKFSTSVITCWGNINLYFLSQFHYQGTNVTSQTNSVILLFSVPIMVVTLLFSNKLCDRFGFKNVIRVSCLLFCLSPLVNIFSFNIYTFTIFSVLVPGSMYTLISVPVLACVWTYFPQSKNKATSILVVAFGIGGLVWNMLFMHMINPNNQDTTDEHSDIHFFSQEVTKNVHKTAVVGFLLTGIGSIIGSLLIDRNETTQDQLKQQKDQKDFDDVNIQRDDKLESQQGLKKQQINKDELTYKDALKDQRFLIIMLISILTGLYEIYLTMNFKIIFMPLISDDHFLSYASMVCSVISIGGAFFWGWLGDYKGIYFTILLLSILDLGGKIFSDFAFNKPMIIVMVCLIGLISKSMTTLAGPGLAEIFGLKLGTQLLPLKGVAIIIGYILVPLFQILLAKYLNPHEYLVFVSFFSLITLIAALRLYCISSSNKSTPTILQNHNKQSKQKTIKNKDEALQCES